MYTKLSGKFVNLIKLEPDDAEITLKWRLSEKAARLNTGAQSLIDQEEFIKSRPNNELNFIIQLKSGVKVGMISLIKIDFHNKNAETARFLIGEQDLVSGIPVAVESMKLLYDLAFKHLDLERVYGYISSENKLMIKWQLFMGMTREGVLRRHLLSRNLEFVDAIAMGLLKSEYIASVEARYINMINLPLRK